MTKYKFYILILSLAIFGCQKKSDSKKKSDEFQTEAQALVDVSKLKADKKFNCNRFIISLYDNGTPISKSYKSFRPFSTKLIYETKDQKVIDDFEKMTKQGKRTGYCCCPDRNYTIAFYDKTNNYQDYYVDTVEFKDKVRIYQSSFQFGHHF